MKKIILIPLVVFSLIILPSYSQVKKICRKAEAATGRLQYEKALDYYDQALQKDSNYYRANVGKGMVLAEFLGRYDKAIPYLQKALKESPKDTLVRINYTLGKGYHLMGDYDRALYYYKKMYAYGEAGNPDFGPTLNRRIANCQYALTHKAVAPESEQSVKNLGATINSAMPEYAAVIIGNDILFTSKRKDDAKEKRNGVDGKYFESMYRATNNNGVYTTPVRYTLPDYQDKANYFKHNESVISASADGKKLFIFRDGKIYEAEMNTPGKDVNELDKNINIAKFQNHACLSADGKQLFFTSEAKKGVGGTDIYLSKKGEDGNWSSPEMLDTTINTYFDEDAPFLSYDGTLYFSSNGLPGYGGYDVYKTRFENGRWTHPENLGQPINSGGDDIFFVLNNGSSYGYYSSSQAGGMGDMDIYKVHYLAPGVKECQPNMPLMTMNAIQNENNNLYYHFSSELPAEYSSSVRYYTWKINDSTLLQTNPQFDYVFDKPGRYDVSVKAVLYCDTCAQLYAVCTDKAVVLDESLFNNSDLVNNNPALREQNKKNEEDKKSTWTPSPVYFEFNKSTLPEDGLAILDYNITELKKNLPVGTIMINGYADSRGSDAYNKNLSAKRAEFVKQYFLEKGIPKNKIKGIYAYGETNLVNNCSDGVECDEAQHQMNRRVEFKIIDKENKAKSPYLSVTQK